MLPVARLFRVQIIGELFIRHRLYDVHRGSGVKWMDILRSYFPSMGSYLPFIRLSWSQMSCAVNVANALLKKSIDRLSVAPLASALLWRIHRSC